MARMVPNSKPYRVTEIPAGNGSVKSLTGLSQNRWIQ